MKRWIAYCIAPLLGIAGAIGVIVTMSACATSQTVLPSEQLQIQEIIEVNRPQNELYVLTMEWMAKTFKSSKAVIQYEDKEAGKIVGKGFVLVNYPHKLVMLALMDAPSTTLPTWFTITCDIKENKVRITFDNFYVEVKGSEFPIEQQKSMDCLQPEIQQLITNLKKFLIKREEEW